MFVLDNFIADRVTFRADSMFNDDIDANKEILKNEVITTRSPYNDYRGLALIIEPGYYYTFVLDKYWFANVFAAPGFGVDFYNDKEIDTVNNTVIEENNSSIFFSIYFKEKTFSCWMN